MVDLITLESPVTSGAAPAHLSRVRVERLLQVASLLLARGQLTEVQVLHAMLGKELGLGCVGPAYSSGRSAEEYHRSLFHALARHRAEKGEGKGSPSAWLQRIRSSWVLWVSWAIVVAVTGSLSLRYGYAFLQRLSWQHEHPDGKWISRYYGTRRATGTPIVRYDVAVDYDWRKSAPAPTLPRDEWAAKWDTCIVATSDTDLQLTLVVDDTARLMLDGEQQLQLRSQGRKSAQVHLSVGVHHLHLEYREGRARARIRLEGLEFDGSDSYQFQRPILDADDLHCEGMSSASNSAIAPAAAAGGAAGSPAQ